MAKAVASTWHEPTRSSRCGEGGEPTVIPNARVAAPSLRGRPSPKRGTAGLASWPRRQAILNPKGNHLLRQRFIGRHYDEVSDEAKAVAFRRGRGAGGPPRFEVRGKQYGRRGISALVRASWTEDAPSRSASGSPRP